MLPREVAYDIVVANANLYLSRELCDAYFAQVTAVALIARGQRILIVPLSQASAGGLILKQRNLRGDRVIHAQEFFRENGFDEHFDPRMVSVHWSVESAALVIDANLRGPDAGRTH